MRVVIRLAAALIACCSASLAVTAASASPAWWTPAGLTGTPLRAVQTSGAIITVLTQTGATLRSTDSGRHFAPAPGVAVSTSESVTAGTDRWKIDSGGTVLHAHGGAQFTVDPQAPNLGVGARLLAAPAASPGVVVAVSSNGAVWRRTSSGDWSLSLVLLPSSLLQSTPAVTAVAAFDLPLSSTVYLATDGYSVLLSTDGGDDWIRANPGLPDNVSGLAADSQSRSLYAATSDGLFVHRLQRLPAPQSYHDSALWLRWLGIALVVIISAFAAALALWRLVGSNPVALP